MRLSIIGSGYVGLVTGACFAELGHRVICIDKDIVKIENLKVGIIPIYEPMLEDMVKSNASEGRLRFSTSIKEGVKQSEVIFIAVDTPSKESGEADLSFIEDVAREIARYLSDYRLIVEKSTVPVQTGDWLVRTIRENVRPGVEFDVASNPEFLREGSAINDFLHPDRVVIGATSDKGAALLVKLYEPLNAPILLTDIRSAELIKHSANAFLAMKISFINSIARICERAGADVMKVAKGTGLDKRIGIDFLSAGLGYGGSCFPKDVDAFIKIADSLGYDFKLLKAVREVNREQRKIAVYKAEESLGTLEGKTIAILGLAFKPNTDDMRNAPSVEIIKDLREKGAIVRAYDPVAEGRARSIIGDGAIFCRDIYHAAEGADALVVVTEWEQFRFVDFCKLRDCMRRALVIDGRNIFDPQRMRALGFEYYGIGR